VKSPHGGDKPDRLPLFKSLQPPVRVEGR